VKEKHTADRKKEEIIHNFFHHFVEIMSMEGFVFPVSSLDTKLYSVTLVHPYRALWLLQQRAVRCNTFGV
jgi:hypothetical protein